MHIAPWMIKHVPNDLRLLSVHHIGYDITNLFVYEVTRPVDAILSHLTLVGHTYSNIPQLYIKMAVLQSIIDTVTANENKKDGEYFTATLYQMDLGKQNRTKIFSEQNFMKMLNHP